MKNDSNRYAVWFVDDRQENLERFQSRHARDFDVRVFHWPDEVMAALASGQRPDALVCDIYFYSDEGRREAIESAVDAKAREIRELGRQFQAEEAQLGVRLIREVHDFFGGAPRFPVYAYTSKGAYLMPDEGFDQLEEMQAEWLPKNKCRAETEQRRILRDVEEYAGRFPGSSPARLLAATGILSACLGGLVGFWLARRGCD